MPYPSPPHHISFCIIRLVLLSMYVYNGLPSIEARYLYQDLKCLKFRTPSSNGIVNIKQIKNHFLDTLYLVIKYNKNYMRNILGTLCCHQFWGPIPPTLANNIICQISPMVPEVVCKWLQESNLGQIEGTWGGGSNEGLFGSNLCQIGKLAYI